MTTTYSPEYLKSLSWYVGHENNGRGRLRHEALAMVKNGHLSITKTSYYGWVLRITPEGLELLRERKAA